MVFSDVITDVAFSCGSFVFRQSRAKVSLSLFYGYFHPKFTAQVGLRRSILMLLKW